MNIQDLSIRTKLNVLSAASSGLALLLVCAAFVAYDVMTIRQATVDNLHSVADVLIANSTAALAFDDAEAAQEVLSTLARKHSILRACIYDVDAKVVATYLRSDRPHQQTFGPPPMPGHRFNDDGVLELTLPIADGESVQGMLYVEASMEDLNSRLVADVLVAAIVLVVSLGLSVLASWKLQTVVSKPIVQLAKATEEISTKDDYSVRVIKMANDEIGKLCDAFNHMVARIQERDSQLREAHDDLERRVEERTSQLSEANKKLNAEVAERTAAQERLEQTQQQLVETARQAGMAEVATGVLHNVGNVLNSINVSANLIARTFQDTQTTGLTRAVELMDEHGDDLGSFVTTHERGRHLPDYLRQLSEQLVSERKSMLNELDSLTKNIEHIKEIVAAQQSLSKAWGTTEELNLADVFEEALKLYGTRLPRHGIQVRRDYQEVPAVVAEKHRVIQILVNLISNARHALSASMNDDKQLTLTMRIDRRSEEYVILQVCDNGAGIAPENLTRIFNHGFTTRKKGHGFGLHSSALAARQLGGSLVAESDGPGRGAVFTLELPIAAKTGQGQDTAGTAVLAALAMTPVVQEENTYANA